MKRFCISLFLLMGLFFAENAWAQVRVVVRNAPPPRRVVYVAPRPVPPPPPHVVIVQPAPVRYAYVQPAPVVVVRERRHPRRCSRRW